MPKVSPHAKFYNLSTGFSLSRSSACCKIIKTFWHILTIMFHFGGKLRCNKNKTKTDYRIYLRIGRNFFHIFFNKKHGCDLSARHTLKVFGYCKYRIFRLISRYRHELRLRWCSHIPMRDSFMRPLSMRWIFPLC